MLLVLLWLSYALGSLPLDVVPISYDLDLQLFKKYYTGTVTINLDVKTATQLIALNVGRHLKVYEQELAVNELHFFNFGTPLLVTESKRTDDILFISLNDKLKISKKYSLKVRFKSRSYVGLRRHKDVHLILSTWGRASNGFPCFDEAHFKAPFHVTLTTEAADVCFSAGPAEFQYVGDRQRTAYMATPSLSPSSLGFAIGKLNKKTVLSNRGYSISACVAETSLLSKTFFCMDTVETAVDFMDQMLGVALPNKKIDILPRGSMLPSSKTLYTMLLLAMADMFAGPVDQPMAALKIASLVASQWLGHLVTFEDKWIGEALSLWIAIQSLAKVHPEWYINERVLINVVQKQFSLSLEGSPMTAEKGLALINMIEGQSSVAAVMGAVKMLVAGNVGTHVGTAAVAKIINQQTGFDFDVILDWATRENFPLIKVALKEKSIKLTQVSLKDGKSLDKPFVVPFKLPDDKTYILDKDKDVFDAKGGFVKLNNGGKYFYRVLYPVDWYANIKSDSLSALTPIDQAQLILEIYSLTQFGHIPYEFFVRTLKKASKSNVVPVWMSIEYILTDMLSTCYIDQITKSTFYEFARVILEPKIRSISMKPTGKDSSDLRTIRGILTGIGGKCYNYDVLPVSSAYFKDFVDYSDSIKDRFAYLAKVLHTADFDFRAIPSELFPQTIVNAVINLEGFACSPLKSYLALTKDTDHYVLLAFATALGFSDASWFNSVMVYYTSNFPHHGLSFLDTFNALSINPENTSLLWKQFKCNFEDYMEAWTTDPTIFALMLDALFRNVIDEDLVNSANEISVELRSSPASVALFNSYLRMNETRQNWARILIKAYNGEAKGKVCSI